VSHQEIIQALANFSPNAREKLLTVISSKTNKFRGVILAENALIMATFLQQSIEELMLKLLPLASLYACPPISKFKVGAVSRGASGNLYLGANMEFVGQALSMSIHAEQSAVNNAWLNGEVGLSSIAINYLPCGYCRQFLNELVTASSLKILLPNQPTRMLNDLLPEPFSPNDLGIEGGLMMTQNHNLQLYENSNDAVVIAALSAANQSYAPYSKGYSGIALFTTDDKIYTGRYAENVAFNPSMSPLQSALFQLNLGGSLYQDIQRAVLVEKAATECSQIDVTRNVLKSVCNLELEVIYLK
jgi:cytidine deaminase